MRVILDLVASLVSPERCAGCDEPVPRRAAFCPSCAQSIEPRASNRGDVWAPYSYGGALAHAIHRFKYASRPDLARPLAGLLLRGIPDDLDRPPDCVIPVPLHSARLVDRGFNQAALLARPVARHLGARLCPRGLERVRDTPRQALLDRQQRAKNLDGAFRAPRGLAGARVLLVDDVRTTGATLEACDVALRAAGARAVCSLVLAAVDL